MLSQELWIRILTIYICVGVYINDWNIVCFLFNSQYNSELCIMLPLLLQKRKLTLECCLDFTELHSCIVSWPGFELMFQIQVYTQTSAQLEKHFKTQALNSKSL